MDIKDRLERLKTSLLRSGRIVAADSLQVSPVREERVPRLDPTDPEHPEPIPSGDHDAIDVHLPAARAPEPPGDVPPASAWDRFELLGELRRARDLPPPPPRRRPAPVDLSVPGPFLHLTFTYGPDSLPGEWLASLRDLTREDSLLHLETVQPDGRAVPFESLVFLDTETTGLSTGAGTLAFLVGLLWVEQDQIHLHQLFVRDPGEEAAMLDILAGIIGRHQVLVTYNGKTFDAPLLTSRFIFNRRRPRLPDDHADLLTLVRRLFRLRIGDCSLKSVERKLLDVVRVEDLPSSEIPAAYFRYVMDGDEATIPTILEHNRQDLLSLLGVLAQCLDLLHRGLDDPRVRPEDLLSLATHFERLGDHDRAIRGYQRTLALPGRGPGIKACKRLGRLLKQAGAWDEATRLWSSMVQGSPVPTVYPYEELAKYHEHRTRDIASALAITSGALSALSAGLPGTLHTWPEIRSELEHREERLRRKLSRRKL